MLPIRIETRRRPQQPGRASNNQQAKSERGDNEPEADAQDDGDERHREERFRLAVADCKRYFGLWDQCDPVVWAILRVVQAQNDLMKAIELTAYDMDERVVEYPIAECIKAIAALQKAIEQEPRGFP
jgi:hypothetical protein